MVSKLDILLVIGLHGNENLIVNDVLAKLKLSSYRSVYNYVNELIKENFVFKKNNFLYLEDNQKAKELFSLVYFCFKNNLDYNIIVSEVTANFLKTGLEKEVTDNLLYSYKTIHKLIKYLSRAGFLIIESKKPLVCRVVPSNFITLLIKYFFNYKVNPEEYSEFLLKIDDSILNKSIDLNFKKYSKSNSVIQDKVNFIYSSLSLEGITLTLPETEKLIKESVTPNIQKFEDIQQTIDYKRAIDFLIHDELNFENILKFHGIAMSTLDYGKGEVRKQNVKIKGNPDFRTPDHKNLEKMVLDFSKILNEFNFWARSSTKIKAHLVVNHASILHNDFQRMHPFIDGNSRTSRAIFSVYLIKFGFPLVNIPAGYFDIYMIHTKLSKERDDNSFKKLMKLIVLKNLEDR